MRIITIARKPLSEKTVAQNVLKHGCGGINVGGCRIGAGKRLNAQKGGENINKLVRPHGNNSENASGMGAYGVGAYQYTTGHKEVEGRWPANLILTHKVGCECVGMKKVKGISGGDHSGREETHEHVGGFGHDRHSIQRHNDKDGKETIEDWRCVEGCPVAEINMQGVGVGSHSAGNYRKNYQHHSPYQPTSYGAPDTRQMDRYGDQGGVSRFFKHIKS